MKMKRSAGIAGLTLLLGCVSAGASSAATYYMAPNGSDSSSGSISAPWASYKRAQAVLKPGDTLYARGGLYGPRAGQGRDWKVSGTASAPITFSAYPGERPVFDGNW